MALRRALIWVLIVLAAASHSRALVAQEKTALTQFVPLFNGKDLTGWVVSWHQARGKVNPWQVEPGALAVTGHTKAGGRSFLMTEREYGDYRLRFEYQLEKGGNSGLALRGTPGEYPTELDLVDDADKHWATAPTGQMLGDKLRKIAVKPLWPARLKPEGEWNAAEVEVRGQRVRAWINGNPVQDADLDKLIQLGSTFPDLKRTRGRIGLQQLIGAARFRKIQIRELPPVARDDPVKPPPALKGQGLLGEYFADLMLDAPGITRVDPTIAFSLGRNQPPWQGQNELKPNDGWYTNFSVCWTGSVTPRYSETYTFSVTPRTGALLWVNNELLVSAWPWKGAKVYSGRIKLTAGKPVPVKLIYYSMSPGASLEFEWSSDSQKREVVPASALTPPAPAAIPPREPVPSLAGRVQVLTIDLPHPVKHNPLGFAIVRPSLVMLPATNGTYKLGWNDTRDNAHITTLSAALKSAGKDIDLPGLELRSLTVDPDGAMGVLVHDPPLKMWCLGFDKNGTQQFKTILCGHKGTTEAGERFTNNDWCRTGRIAGDGKLYCVHFGHEANYGKDGSHLVGYRAILDRAGKFVREEGWFGSHNLDQLASVHRGNFLTLCDCDCFPLGLDFSNLTLGPGRLVYPPPGKRKAFDADNTHLGSMISLESDVAVTFTNRKKIMYLLLDDIGRVLHTAQLGELKVWAGKAEPSVKIIPFGKNLLVAWSENQKSTLEQPEIRSQRRAIRSQ